jgi:hypothetical protein
MTFRETWARDFEATWRRVYPVLGIRTVIEASAPVVEPAVERAFGVWDGFRGSLDSGPTITLRIRVSDASEGADGHAPVTYRLEEPERLVATTPGSTAVGDAVRGEAWATVSRALVADIEHFRYTFVEALIFFLLSSRDRQPLHCAALERQGRVLILSGAPGVGKSTLAYAASLRGFRVMAEDMVWVQQHPRFRIWGGTPVIQLPEDAPRWFADLGGGRTLIANGRDKIVVPVRPECRPQSLVVEAGAICLLERRAGPTSLTPIDREALREGLAARLQAGFDRFPSTIPAVVQGLAPQGGWRLSIGGDPREAVRCIEDASQWTW